MPGRRMARLRAGGLLGRRVEGSPRSLGRAGDRRVEATGTCSYPRGAGSRLAGDLPRRRRRAVRPRVTVIGSADAHEPGPSGHPHRRQPAAHPELAVDPAEMGCHRPLADAQPGRDLSRGEPFRRHSEHLSLALRQQRVEITPPLDAIGDQARRPWTVGPASTISRSRRADDRRKNSSGSTRLSTNPSAPTKSARLMLVGSAFAPTASTAWNGYRSRTSRINQERVVWLVEAESHQHHDARTADACDRPQRLVRGPGFGEQLGALRRGDEHADAGTHDGQGVNDDHAEAPPGRRGGRLGPGRGAHRSSVVALQCVERGSTTAPSHYRRRDAAVLRAYRSRSMRPSDAARAIAWIRVLTPSFR